jgi:hypothetical protein
MKYLLLMNGPAEAWQSLQTMAPTDQATRAAFLRDLARELRATGEWILAGVLASEGARVRGRDDRRAELATAGARASGYWLVDCETLAAAVAIAARLSAAPGRGGAPSNLPVEVRPVMAAAGQEIYS